MNVVKSKKNSAVITEMTNIKKKKKKKAVLKNIHSNIIQLLCSELHFLINIFNNQLSWVLSSLSFKDLSEKSTTNLTLTQVSIDIINDNRKLKMWHSSESDMTLKSITDNLAFLQLNLNEDDKLNNFKSYFIVDCFKLITFLKNVWVISEYVTSDRKSSKNKLLTAAEWQTDRHKLWYILVLSDWKKEHKKWKTNHKA